MLSFKQRVDTIIRVALAPHLKRAGFRKHGATFRLAREDHTQILSVNSSSQQVPGEGIVGSYSVEIGIYFPEVFRIGNNREEENPHIHECAVTGGLPLTNWGFFDDLKDDCPSIEEQSKSLEIAWLEHGATWFEQYCEPQKAFQLAKASDDPKEAFYFAIHLKEWDQAAEYLRKCRIMWGGGSWGEYLEKIAQRYDVPGALKR